MEDIKEHELKIKEGQNSTIVSTEDQSKSQSVSDAVLQSFEISHEEVDVGTFLAEGSFGKVFKGTWRFKDVAIKQLHDQLSTKTMDELRYEASIMCKLRSPNIVQLYGVCTQTSPFYLIMEFVSKGSLYSILHSSEALSLSQKVSIALDIAKGLAFLHTAKILHRDLKSPNVLIDKHFQAKLTDFGLARVKKESSTLSSKVGAAGRVAWMAPELFKLRPVFTEKSDVYSFGMICWELFTREIPYSSGSNPTLIGTLVSQVEREEIPEDTPPKIAELIRLCWDADPLKRPSAADTAKMLQQL